MIELTLADVARVTGGRLSGATGEERVTGTVEFDSRAVTTGGLFVALPGERVDGHAFVGAAMAAGAAGVLAAREVDAPAVIVPPVHEVSGSYVLAADADGAGAGVLAALAVLARHVVDVLTADGLLVVGITGSSGKTSTKDLTAHLLEGAGETVAPPGSFNNELGHPWTALRATPSTRHLVLELSARGPGHVAALCRVAPPRIGVVLNVGSAHLGEFGSREAIAQAKGELVEALPENGVAVLGADDPVVAAMEHRTAARVVHAGRAPEATVRAVDEALDDAGRATFRLVTPAGEAPVRLALHGAHHVDNALAAAAVALEAGLDVATVAERLGTASARSRWRMELTERPDGVRVLNDAYNANPESMRAALATLGAMGGRHTAVLGMMAELGDDAARAHGEIGREVARTGVERLVVVGADEAVVRLHEAAASAGVDSHLVPDVAAAAEMVSAGVAPGDVVLVKASRSAGLERVAAVLIDGEGAR
ncbi:UDP-N-acetylmuramoyl-tripeptide--D-alanyl-D-alanine ligase [Actinomycetospora sp. NBRC 106375]|uniref:UDP-N-acetylmuramoyl-tripeptide--D-alanyl-D- alanine ligase n=1 Tax=Actinomycetospora sp. NBRC 106375 TaxID=3032207 RepID=UPI0024A4CD89|nr:UDP-N-acetylmuramoyl-tripeptide--D-alanyl-D-alanine ligase [Actinomycetospora sp. NBRC 106375]GLZ47373.1 UDP-N-acetylmuramoyl-tripeptide--D-alanyl-D-alanine ligase [Actinomycetospora sp. NBRC 106375]